jgi:hypothetical protein
MVPILHCHDIRAIHNRHLDAAQEIIAVLPFCRHLESQRAGHEDITLHQLGFVARGHDDPPSLPRDLDAEPEIVVAVPPEIDDMVDREILARRGMRERVVHTGRNGEGGYEWRAVLDLGALWSEREKVV